MNAIFVYVTCQDAREAETLAGRIVGGGLAACANILSPHKSIYRWQGHVEKAEETAVIFKTIEPRFEDLKRAVLEIHSYECPCIIGLPIEYGHGPFLDWIRQETSGEL